MLYQNHRSLLHDTIYAQRIVLLLVRPSVCHTGGSVKNG